MADTSEGGWVRRASTGSAVTRFQALASATISAGMGCRPARIRVRASSTVIIADWGMGAYSRVNSTSLLPNPPSVTEAHRAGSNLGELARLAAGLVHHAQRLD